MDAVSAADGAWILAFIAMVGGVLMAIIKMMEKNGCRCRFMWPTGVACCDTDCDEGRQVVDRKVSKAPVQHV